MVIEGVIEGERERERDWKSGIVMMIRSTIQRDVRRVLLPKYFNGNNNVSSLFFPTSTPITR